MNPSPQLDLPLDRSAPLLALAPMQDITTHAFWKLMATFGGADLYFTEYFRVYPGSRLDKHILRSVVQNPTGRPVIAQLIGNDIPSLVRAARELQACPVAGVDLNLGCPAPVVYRKSAGGGLLRDLVRVDAILGALREAITTRFSVKTRIGFDSDRVFPELLEILAKHSPDLVTVHARTVTEKYGPRVHYEQVARAVRALRCPVLANGNVWSVQSARAALGQTGARGLMIGRGAIRNPWIFEQIRRDQRGEPAFVPLGRDALDYIRQLDAAVCPANCPELTQVQFMKKYMNFFGVGIKDSGAFLHEIRRVTTRAAFFSVCEKFLDHGDPVYLEPPLW
jgi:tRNA-dihydrouridine synthase